MQRHLETHRHPAAGDGQMALAPGELCADRGDFGVGHFRFLFGRQTLQPRPVTRVPLREAPAHGLTHDDAQHLYVEKGGVAMDGRARMAKLRHAPRHIIANHLVGERGGHGYPFFVQVAAHRLPAIEHQLEGFGVEIMGAQERLRSLIPCLFLGDFAEVFCFEGFSGGEIEGLAMPGRVIDPEDSDAMEPFP
jgi:hypothetical protein